MADGKEGPNVPGMGPLRRIPDQKTVVGHDFWGKPKFAQTEKPPTDAEIKKQLEDLGIPTGKGVESPVNQRAREGKFSTQIEGGSPIVPPAKPHEPKKINEFRPGVDKVGRQPPTVPDYMPVPKYTPPAPEITPPPRQTVNQGIGARIAGWFKGLIK